MSKKDIKEEASQEKPSMHEVIEEQLMTVYDPEFPLIDIYTLGLVYDITIHEEKSRIELLMTFTTPQCPMGETIKKMVENALLEVYPGWETTINITFDPMWSPDMIKDKDLQRMFE